DALRRIAVPELAQLAHGGNGRKAVAEALHAPAFVVHGDDERRHAQLADRVRELDELQRRGEIAREEDDAAHLRMLQPLDVVGRELEAGDVDEHGTQPHSPSSTTNATATPLSSVREMWAVFTPSFFRCFSMSGLGLMPGLPLGLRV